MAAESSTERSNNPCDCEEEISPFRRHSLSSRKRQLFCNSSDENDDVLAENDTRQEESCRSSERIRRRHSREFKLPDKRDYWNTIPSKGTPVKSLWSLSPRKLVNNLTKITNRYNAETFDSDDDYDGLDEFIVDDDDESDDSEEERKPKGRIDRNRTLSESSTSKRRRIRTRSSSDSDTEIEQPPKVQTTVKSDTGIDSDSLDSYNESKNFETLNKSCAFSSDDESNFASEVNKNVDSYSDSEDDEDVLRTNSSMKKRIFSSSSDSEDNIQSSSNKIRNSATTRVRQRNEERKQMFQELKESRKKLL